MNGYEYANQIQEILDDALNKLSTDGFNRLLDNLRLMLEDYDE